MVLSQLFEKTSGKLTFNEFEKIFAEFHKLRKPSVDAIADLALENFVEMRDKVSDESFLRLKKIEQKLEQKFPEKFRSRYSMVCYGSCAEGNVTYANAFKLTEKIRELSAKLNHIQDLESEAGEAQLLAEGEKLIDEMILPETQKLEMDLSTMLKA